MTRDLVLLPRGAEPHTPAWWNWQTHRPQKAAALGAVRVRSSPRARPVSQGLVVELARTSPSHGGKCRFEPGRGHKADPGPAVSAGSRAGHRAAHEPRAGAFDLVLAHAVDRVLVRGPAQLGAVPELATLGEAGGVQLGVSGPFAVRPVGHDAVAVGVRPAGGASQVSSTPSPVRLARTFAGPAGWFAWPLRRSARRARPGWRRSWWVGVSRPAVSRTRRG